MWVLLASGCQDYTVVVMQDEQGHREDPVESAPETDTATVPEEVEGGFQANWQMGGFTGTVGRCDVQLAFFTRDEAPETGGMDGQVIEMPDRTGACRFTRFDPDEEVAAGSMVPLGYKDAGESLLLWDEHGEFQLPRDEDDESIRYTLETCAEDYPHGRHLSLRGPGSVRSDGLEAFELEDAVFVGPAAVPTAPPAEDLEPDGSLLWSARDPLRFAWEYLDPPEDGLEPEANLVIRNVYRSDGSGYVNGIFEALYCKSAHPDEFRIPAEVLQLFTPTIEGETYQAVQADVWWRGEQVRAPWGTLAQNSSLTSWGGTMYLYE